MNEEESAVAAEDLESAREAMRKLMGNFQVPVREKTSRKAREQKARTIVDGRSLRAKGRTEQMNVKIRPDIKQAIANRVTADGLAIADWLEITLEAALGMRGN